MLRNVRKYGSFVLLTPLLIYLILYDVTNYEKVIKPLSVWKVKVINSESSSEVEDFPDWQQVLGTKSKTLVYSAYFDSRNKTNPVIRVITIAKNGFNETMYCTIQYSNGRIKTIIAKLYQINWDHGYAYAALYILCPLSGIDKPEIVSILGNLSYPIGNILPVRNTEYDQTRYDIDPHRMDFVLCAKPFYNNYNNVQELLESIEYYLLLGVNKFVFYNYSAHYNVHCALRSYIERNIVILLPYTYNNTEMPIHYVGQNAVIQDCVYRYMYKAKYIVELDPDEYIVPRYKKKAKLKEMVDHVIGHFNKTAESVVGLTFRNSYFYLFHPDYMPKHFPTSLRKIERTAVFPANDRSKCIVNPRRIIEMSIHYPFEFIGPPDSVIDVPENLSICHHYRTCHMFWAPPNSCDKLPVVKDTTMWNYKDEYTQNLNRTVRLINESCTYFN